jgi:hypothetical protein
MKVPSDNPIVASDKLAGRNSPSGCVAVAAFEAMSAGNRKTDVIRGCASRSDAQNPESILIAFPQWGKWIPACAGTTRKDNGFPLSRE